MEEEPHIIEHHLPTDSARRCKKRHGLGSTLAILKEQQSNKFGSAVVEIMLPARCAALSRMNALPKPNNFLLRTLVDVMSLITQLARGFLTAS